MILRGCVQVSDHVATKPAALVANDATIDITDSGSTYVSRAALKLLAGLDGSGFSVSGRHCLDLGASTGGFTQVLLERGAAHVVALDVGHGQMVPSIGDDPRVTVLEGFNARDLTPDDLPFAPEMVVSDMSFISLRLAAEPALLMAANGARAVLLVKPQFEVGREGVGSNGIVRDEALIERTVANIVEWFDALSGWGHTHLLSSPIKGGDGNREFLLCGERA